MKKINKIKMKRILESKGLNEAIKMRSGEEYSDDDTLFSVIADELSAYVFEFSQLEDIAGSITTDEIDTNTQHLLENIYDVVTNPDLSEEDYNNWQRFVKRSLRVAMERVLYNFIRSTGAKTNGKSVVDIIVSYILDNKDLFN